MVAAKVSAYVGGGAVNEINVGVAEKEFRLAIFPAGPRQDHFVQERCYLVSISIIPES